MTRWSDRGSRFHLLALGFRERVQALPVAPLRKPSRIVPSPLSKPRAARGRRRPPPLAGGSRRSARTHSLRPRRPLPGGTGNSWSVLRRGRAKREKRSSKLEGILRISVRHAKLPFSTRLTQGAPRGAKPPWRTARPATKLRAPMTGSHAARAPLFLPPVSPAVARGRGRVRLPRAVVPPAPGEGAAKEPPPARRRRATSRSRASMPEHAPRRARSTSGAATSPP